MTPGIIIAVGLAVSFILATVLHHRRETAALYLPNPSSPERDQGFDEGLLHATDLINQLWGTHVPIADILKAIRAARRGGSR